MELGSCSCPVSCQCFMKSGIHFSIDLILIHGFMDSWIHGFMDSWIHGFMDSWIHGFMDSWIHGFMDSWKVQSYRYLLYFISSFCCLTSYMHFPTATVLHTAVVCTVVQDSHLHRPHRCARVFFALPTCQHTGDPAILHHCRHVQRPTFCI
jgi:hypothetical protein